MNRDEKSSNQKQIKQIEYNKKIITKSMTE